MIVVFYTGPICDDEYRFVVDKFECNFCFANGDWKSLSKEENDKISAF